MRRAIELLRERLADPVSLADLAAHTGLDKFHLCRAFRAQVGLPPHSYLTLLRIERAKQLLTAGVKPREIAAQVGLYDQSQTQPALPPHRGRYSRSLRPRRLVHGM